MGIDVGGTKMLAVAVDRSQPTEILARHLVSTPTTAEGVISSLLELAQMCGTERHLGIGLAGLVENGEVLRAAPNLQCMIDVPVRSAVESALGIAVSIDNDATCALVAETTALASAADPFGARIDRELNANGAAPIGAEA